jgi:hypothetical protein
MDRFGMAPGQGEVAGDGVLISLRQAAGGPRPAAFAEVIEHLGDLIVREPRLLQDGALTLRGAGLAGAARDHADAFALAAPATEGEITLAPETCVRAVGILATEDLDGVHVDPSRS